MEEDLRVDGETSLYEHDFWAWTTEQAALLRSGRLQDVDVVNIAEELEGLARKEMAELRSRLRVLMLHLLKETYQPERASRSWAATIIVQRQDLAKHLENNPSLRPRLRTIFAETFVDARSLAVAETGLPPATFPISPPFAAEEALDPAFWPGASPNERR